MADLTGQRWGDYEIQERIGEGGMATVYKAYERPLGRYVAIKVLNEALGHDPAFIRRFQREARTAAVLAHPYIVRIYKIGQQGDLHYLAMDYIAGPSLAEQIRRGGPLDPARALAIFSQIGAALDYAHAHRVIHRDVKPTNILLTPDGHAVLGDFGIARAASAADQTHPGLVGTPQYMSPEQAQGQPLDGRSDLYSLAIVLYEMLTGRVPFQANTPTAVLYKQVHVPPPPPSQLNRAIPRTVEQVILRGLDKRRERRYASAAAMAEALSQALGSRQPGQTPRPAPRQSSRPGARVWLPLGGVAAIALVAAMALGSGWIKPGGATGATRTPAVVRPTLLVPGRSPSPSPAGSAARPTSTVRAPVVPTPTPTGLPTLLPTPVPGLLAPPVLASPSQGSQFQDGRIAFRWTWQRPLQPGESYDLRVWREGEEEQGIACLREARYDYVLPGPGNYRWNLAVIRGCGTAGTVAVSNRSATWAFVCYPPGAPPAPAATSAPPTSAPSASTATPKPTAPPPTATRVAATLAPRPTTLPPLTMAPPAAATLAPPLTPGSGGFSSRPLSVLRALGG